MAALARRDLSGVHPARVERQLLRQLACLPRDQQLVIAAQSFVRASIQPSPLAPWDQQPALADHSPIMEGMRPPGVLPQAQQPALAEESPVTAAMQAPQHLQAKRRKATGGAAEAADQASAALILLPSGLPGCPSCMLAARGSQPDGRPEASDRHGSQQETVAESEPAPWSMNQLISQERLEDVLGSRDWALGQQVGRGAFGGVWRARRRQTSTASVQEPERGTGICWGSHKDFPDASSFSGKHPCGQLLTALTWMVVDVSVPGDICQHCLDDHCSARLLLLIKYHTVK